MSFAADTFAVSTPDVAAVTPEGEPTVRRFAAGKFAVAFLATVLVGSGLRAVAESGVNTAIDNYYAKQAAAFAVPVPELNAAMNAANDASTDTAVTAAQ